MLTVQRSTEAGTPEFRIFRIDDPFAATISGLSIHNGRSTKFSGGGISNHGYLTIIACLISGNSTTNGGGAIFNNGGDPGAYLSITNCTISGNSAVDGNLGGGGIFDGGGSVIVTDSTISGNSGGNGGGGGIFTYGAVDIFNSTISGNSADNGLGGGIYFTRGLYVTNSTVCNNTASEGGGVKGTLGTAIHVRSTIVAQNNATTSPDVSAQVYSLGYNLIGDPTGAFINGSLVGNQLNVDPLLDVLQYNGGATQTHALLPGSPAINKGLSAGLVTDQRGFIRPIGSGKVGDGSDIGAFEVQPTTGVSANLGNISTRLRVETGANVLIGGFIVSGTQPKRIIVRAIGPSLPIVGALVDPVLELRDSSGGIIASNDNWRSHEAEIIATGIPPSNDLEAALVATLPANNSAYTAVVSGAANTTGIGIVEVYDLDSTVDSKLANISTRGFVATGDNAMIGGTIVTGSNPGNVLVRAIGPSLLDVGVSNPLPDPLLELHDASGTLIASNDNWRSGDQEFEIIATGIPPTDNLESAVLANLSPGAYTAIVSGVDNVTGVGLVEVYQLH